MVTKTLKQQDIQFKIHPILFLTVHISKIVKKGMLHKKGKNANFEKKHEKDPYKEKYKKYKENLFIKKCISFGTFWKQMYFFKHFSLNYR